MELVKFQDKFDDKELQYLGLIPYIVCVWEEEMVGWSNSACQKRLAFGRFTNLAIWKSL